MANSILLPSNLEAERAVLGSMLIEASATDIALATLRTEDFSDADPRNRLVFEAMKELHSRKIPVDAETVIGQLINAKKDEIAGGVPYLLELVNTTITPENINQYVEMVKEESVLRQLLLKANQIIEQYGKGVPSVSDFIVEANNEITKIAQQRTVGGMRSAQEVAITVENMIAEKMNADNRGVTGISSGYRSLDNFTHGWQKGDLIILAARPSVGKTALGMNFAYNAAYESKVPVGFFSLEMGAEKVMERLIASRATVPNDKIQTGFLKSNEQVKVHAAVQEIATTNLYIDDTSDSLLGDLLAKATRLKTMHPDLGLIVIDYLGKIRYQEKADLSQRQQEVSYVSTALKSLARRLNVPVICLAQLNRNVDQNEDKRPSLSNLRESGAIEQDADMVLLMYRPDYYTNLGISTKTRGQRRAAEHGEEDKAQEQNALSPEEREKNGDASDTEIIVAKNRNGKTGTIHLLFTKSYSRFSEPTPDYIEKQAAIEYAATTGTNPFGDDSND